MNDQNCIDISKKKRLLIVDDEIDLTDLLAKLLQEYGFEVTISNDGKKALNLLALEQFDGLISDVNLPGVDGMDLLRYSNDKLQMPVVLITGFSKSYHVKEAEQLGVKAFLSKPFTRNDIVDVLKEIFKKDAVEQVEEIKNLDEDFRKVSIDDFVSGKEIKYDIYVRLSESKYVKIANQGENIDVARITLLKNKGIHHLFLTKSDFKNYIEFNIKLVRAAAQSRSLPSEKKARLLKNANDVILTRLNHESINNDDINDAKDVIETSISILGDIENGEEILNVLNSNKESRFNHDIGVVFYSVLIAKQLGWDAKSTIYKLSLAALLHDIGLKEIDAIIVNKTKLQLTPNEITLLESHPYRGAMILSQMKSIPTEVIQAVLQHHETCSGTGYPYRLRRIQISPMAKIVAVAESFCDLVVGESQLAPPEAISRLNLIHKDSLDSVYMNALAAVFNIKSSDSSAA